MRYDTPIYFQKVTAGAYDETTGDYAEDIVEEDKIYADVTWTGETTINRVYGHIVEGVLTVRLQRHYDKPFDFIRIIDKRYRVDFKRRQRSKETFIVSEVQ